MMNLSGRKVLVVGLGASGVAAAELCRRHGARVIGNDAAPADQLSPEARALADHGIQLALGGHSLAPWRGADLVVVSPGVPELDEMRETEARGIEVIGELELASRFATAPIVAVGGTNGKSTTTSLVAAMLEKSGKRVFAGGNLGTPLSARVHETFDVLVLEVSSFQTERIPTFCPKVATLLNITPDHLDRYSSFTAYAAAKGNMFVRQTDEDAAIIPKGDALCAREAARGDGRTITFGATGDVGVDADAIVDRLRERRYPLSELKLSGAHHISNACAAVACASEAGASEAAIRTTLAGFEGLPHRTVRVAEVRGVRYYDDSKGTNVGASVAALRGLTEARAVLIAGGRDKLGAYDPLVAALTDKGRALVVMGEAAERIAAAVGQVVPVERAASMDEAVRMASKLAHAGDAVLLSPACSSFDMFRDYKDRGDAFVRAVRALSEEGS